MKLVSKQDPVNPMLHQQLLINPKLMTLTRLKELKQGEEINSRESTLEQYLYLSVTIIITTTITIIIMITLIITTTLIITFDHHHHHQHHIFMLVFFSQVG